MSYPLIAILFVIFFIGVLASALIGSRFLFRMFKLIFVITFSIFILIVLTT